MNTIDLWFVDFLSLAYPIVIADDPWCYKCTCQPELESASKNLALTEKEMLERMWA